MSSIAEVRVTTAEWNRLFDLAFGDYTEHHDDATHCLKADFIRILKASRDGHFTLERV